jgi:hypothetical protein
MLLNIFQQSIIMKKLFTLLAAATVALTMNAQTEDFENYKKDASVTGVTKFNPGLTESQSLLETAFSGSSLKRTQVLTVVEDAPGDLALEITVNAGDGEVKPRTAASFTTGQVYTISFDAKADTDGIQINSGTNAETYTLTTSYQTFTYNFTVGDNKRIVILITQEPTSAPDKITIDNVSIDLATSISNTAAEAFSIYDNADKVEVFNLAGVKVAEASNTTIANIELNSGVYIAVATKNGQTAKIKFVK